MEQYLIPDPNGPKSKWYTRKWLHIGLLVLLPALIYLQSVQFGYTNFDDNGIILQRFDIVGNLHNIGTAFKVDAFFNKTGDFYRPVQNISFMLDAAVSHEQLWMFHITNLLIHILTCLSLYFFLLLLGLKRVTAFLASLLFAVHPLFASGVGWIPSRGDILIGLFGIQLFMTFALYFKTKKFGYFILHVLLFFLTLFTKETTVLFPLFLLYYYFLVLHKLPWKGEGVSILTLLKTSFLQLLPFFTVWAVALVAYLFMRKGVVAGTGATMDVLGIIPFFKNNPVIPIIISKFFVPFHLSTLPLYDNLSTIIGVVFLLALVFITVDYSKKKKWAVLMGMLWFLFFAVPPTIYRLENADTFFNYLEHRTYLPMIGIVIILGFVLDSYLMAGLSIERFACFYIPVIAVFSVLAFVHCGDYRDNSTLASRAAKLNNPSGLSMRAGNYLSKNDTANALADMEKAIEISPQDANLFLSRGKIRARMQQHEAAEQDFTLAITLNPALNEAFLLRSIERRYLKKYETAFRDIYTAMSRDTANPKIYLSFGNLFVEVRNYKDAVASYSRAIALQPNFAETYNNRGYAKLFLHDYQGALYDCRTAIGLMGQSPSPYSFNNMGHAYRDMGQMDSAFHYFDLAIAAKARFPEAYFERGMAKQRINDPTGACADWKKALAQGYRDTARIIERYCGPKP